jgi:putative phage-type endonuclease
MSEFDEQPNENDSEYEESDSEKTSESEESQTILSDEQYEEIEQNIQSFIFDLLSIKEEMLRFRKPDYIKDFVSEISHTIFDGLVLSEICKETDEEIFDTMIELAESTFDYCLDIHQIPPRSEPSSIELNSKKNIPHIRQRLNLLRDIPQPVQRTSEWYEFRHNLMTASNLYKVFGSESNINSLIYEKCKPFTLQDDRSGGYTNTTSPMHWGTKYEALTVALYEFKNNTKIEEFGCIPHSVYPFIGASPDGINADPISPLYGRMLEIKNIVNREIDGIPSEAYWTQMQIQMETCDLDECDFVETRFKEYGSEEEFWLDTSKGKGEKGVVLYFIRRDCRPVPPRYIFSPLNMILEKEEDKDNLLEWIESAKLDIGEEWILFEINYWYLDEYSCVLVKRNKKWFEAAVPHIQTLWNIILRERIEGYEHRAPKKKVKKIEETENGENEHINIDGSKIVTIVQNSVLPIVKLE